MEKDFEADGFVTEDDEEALSVAVLETVVSSDTDTVELSVSDALLLCVGVRVIDFENERELDGSSLTLPVALFVTETSAVGESLLFDGEAVGDGLLDTDAESDREMSLVSDGVAVGLGDGDAEAYVIEGFERDGDNTTDCVREGDGRVLDSVAD